MMEICSYDFTENDRKIIEQKTKGRDWPVVYLIYNENAIYIGETTSAATRMKQHLINPQKKAEKLKKIKIIFDDTYNKSVILDFEQKLIKCYSSDKKFKKILNRNAGQSSTHDYYDRKKYYNVFKELWNKLYVEKMTNNPIDKLENQNIFKYSPYNSLTEEQNEISIKVLNDILDKFNNSKFNGEGISLINGGAGTGKTVLAISMINSLVNAVNLDESEFSKEDLSNEKLKVLLKIKDYIRRNKSFKIGFVFPMTSIKKIIANVFKECGNGLNKNMVISPYKLENEEFDILFVDEAHRLKQKKNLSGQQEYNLFNKTCNSLGFEPNEATQLDWIIKNAKYKVLFFDKNQTIKSTDITYDQFNTALEKSKQNILDLTLNTQMRCEGGETYIDYIKKILNCQQTKFEDMVNGYEFKIFDNIDVMINEIREKDKRISLCRTVSGYSWEWKTNCHIPKIKDNLDYYNKLVRDGKFDIEIDNHKYIWNIATEGWVTRKDSPYTIGCIHSTQGIDLNIVGVIFGKEIDYDINTNSITIDLNKFFDSNVKKGCDEKTIKQYIFNAYTTMMTRGIKGCYVYAYNSRLREYLKNFIKTGD